MRTLKCIILRDRIYNEEIRKTFARCKMSKTDSEEESEEEHGEIM
jgi:hypothetical protein